jgi:hypothetical protein
MRPAWPRRLLTRTWLALAAVAACAAPPPGSVDAEVACAPEGSPLRQRCTVRLSDRKTGRAVEGATVTLTADMPSMPLAHSVRPVAATAGPRPGTYRGILELEMAGRWVVAIRLEGPVKDQLTHTLDVGR